MISPVRKNRFVALILLGAAALAGAAVGWRWWRGRQEEAAVLAALPAVPDLAAWPRAYAVRVAVATAAARGREQPASALRELALLYHANGRYREAAEAERGLRALEPGNARWAYLLADASEKLGDADAERSLLETTLRLAPYYAAARLRLADLLLKLGFPDQARTQYERFLALAPGEPHARLGLARLALDGGDREGGARELEALVREHPDFPAAHNLLAEVYALAGDTKRAEAERRRGGSTGEGQGGDDPWLRGMYAWSFNPFRTELAGGADAQAQVLAATLPFYETIAREEPDDAAACEALGGLDLQLNRPDDAAAVLAHGIERAPQAAELYTALARARRRQGHGPEAVDVLQRGMRAAPSAPVLPFEMGVLLESEGRRAEAAASYRAALRLDPDFAEAQWNLGLCLLALDRLSDAQASLGRAIDLRPRQADALVVQAQQALVAGKLGPARCCLQVLVDHSPGMPVRDLVERGLALARRAGDADASRDFARLLARPPP